MDLRRDLGLIGIDLGPPESTAYHPQATDIFVLPSFLTSFPSRLEGPRARGNAAGQAAERVCALRNAQRRANSTEFWLHATPATSRDFSHPGERPFCRVAVCPAADGASIRLPSLGPAPYSG
jgi:hypothetical protein